MGELIKLLAVLAAFFLLIGIAWVAALKLGLLKPIAKKDAATARDPKFQAYRVRDGVLGAGERAFLPVLRDAVKIAWAARQPPPAVPPVVFPSVRLAEVLAVGASRTVDRSAWQSAFNQISSKQADFVVCDTVTTRPLLVVELDDSSHDRADRQDRDGFVDRACASAGLPILHIRAAASYNAQDVARRIAEALSSGGRVR
jgi:hypothetical protein